jgi:hypothetical protein
LSAGFAASFSDCTLTLQYRARYVAGRFASVNLQRRRALSIFPRRNLLPSGRRGLNRFANQFKMGMALEAPANRATVKIDSIHFLTVILALV